MDFNKIILYISLLKEDIDRLTIEKLKEMGIEDIKLSHAPVIVAIYRHQGRIQIGDLTNRLRLSKSTITSMVNKLEALDYIKREPCEDDKRVTYLIATSKAEQFFFKMDEIIKEIIQLKFSRFSVQEKEFFYRLIEQTFDDPDKQFSLDKLN